MAEPGQELVDILFVGGIDERTRPELVDVRSAWRVLENGRQTMRGGYAKRPGFGSLGSNARISDTGASTRTKGYKIVPDDLTGTLVIDDGSVDSYAPGLTASSALWRNVGRLPECALSMRYVASGIANGIDTFAVEDIEECNGFVAILYTASATGTGNIIPYLAIYDATTGTMVRAPEPVTAGGSAKATALVSYSTYFVVVNGYSSTIDHYYCDTTNIAAGWVTSTGPIASSGFAGGRNSPMAVTAINDRVIVAYINSAGPTNYVNVVAVTVSNAALQSTTVNTSSVQPAAVDIIGTTADTVWVSWSQTTTPYIIGLTPTALGTIKATTTSLSISTPIDIARIGLVMSSTTGQGWAVVETTNTIFAQGFQTSAGAAAILGSAGVWYGARCAGRPYRVGSRYYVPIYGGMAAAEATNFKQICVHVDISDVSAKALRPVANIAPYLAVTSTYKKTKTKQSSADPTLYRFAVGVKRTGLVNGAAIATMDFASSERWKAVSLNGSTFLTGGALSYFDGQRVAEVGFVYPPSQPTTSTSGTGITATTGWKYVCTFEEPDADGNWCVSGISDPSASTGAVANKTVSVVTMPLAATARKNARCVFYRTLDGGNPPYYRVGAVAMDATAGVSVTFADAINDATLANQAKLYSPSLPSTPGNSQDRRAPPGLTHIVAYNGMLVGAESSNIWYSGQQVAGEGTWFSPVFQLPVEGDGDITGLFVQDGTLFVCKRRAIYAVNGEAPSDNGGSGGLGLPRRLASDVGCIDGRSIVGTSKGTFFQSERGIEIMQRSQEVAWAGETISQTTAAFPVCVAATLNPVTNLVMFELASSETDNQVGGTGRCAVFDLSANTWVSTDRRTSSLGVADAPTQSACVIWTGSAFVYAILDTSGNVRVETPSSFLDGGFWIAKRALTGNVKASSVQGTQQVNKVLLLAQQSTTSNISMAWANDYATSRKTARTWTDTELTAINTALRTLQLQLDADDEARGQAAQVEILDASPSGGIAGSGAGAVWVGLTVERVESPGAFQLPDIAR